VSTNVVFLGTCANLPYEGDDCTSFVINGKYLVDTGWYGTVRMLSFGLDPSAIEYLFITHRHNDHILGLAQFLLYRRIRKGQNGVETPRLRIVGPAADLDQLVERAITALLWSEDVERPETIPLPAGGVVDTEAFRLSTCASQHTAEGLVYRFLDKATGKEIGYSGDTLYDEAIVRHLTGVSLMIHEACYSDGDPLDKPGKHCQPRLAATAALKAGARSLLLVHATPRTRAGKVASASEIFPNCRWPKLGERITVE
jgi:ribonuclease Z